MLAEENSKVDGDIGVEKAVEILNLERAERIGRVTKQIQAILDKENCTLEATFILKPNQIIPQIEIVSR